MASSRNVHLPAGLRPPKLALVVAALSLLPAVGATFYPSKRNKSKQFLVIIQVYNGIYYSILQYITIFGFPKSLEQEQVGDQLYPLLRDKHGTQTKWGVLRFTGGTKWFDLEV